MLLVIDINKEDYKLALSRGALLGGMLDKKLVDAVRSGRRIEEAEPHECNTCKFGRNYENGYDATTMNDECGGCCSWNDKWQPKAESEEEEIG